MLKKWKKQLKKGLKMSNDCLEYLEKKYNLSRDNIGRFLESKKTEYQDPQYPKERDQIYKVVKVDDKYISYMFAYPTATIGCTPYLGVAIKTVEFVEPTKTECITFKRNNDEV